MIVLKSAKMTAGRTIPVDFTADGKDLSPPLEWTNLPEETKSIALICDDPDAPTPNPWVHWVIYNIPSSAKGLPEGLPKSDIIKKPQEIKGATQGLSGWGKPGYRGPAPPKGKVHRYYFKLYALDKDLNLKPGLRKDALEKAMNNHILAQGEFIATYQRK